MSNPIRVLIVDDSAIVRKVLAGILAEEKDIEVVGTAPDPYIARDKILALAPDVVTLDIEMPRMDGLTFLDRLMAHHPMPVIIVSSLANNGPGVALEALRRGAVEVVPKPGGPYSVSDLKGDLAQKIRNASRARCSVRDRVQPATKAAVASTAASTQGAHAVELIVIGASTGGTVAIEEVLRLLPATMPPIAIVQHIPAGFSAAFSERLNGVCHLRVEEAVEGRVLTAGLAVVAPGNRHMRLVRQNGRIGVRLDDGPKVCYQRPAVDILFRSVVQMTPAATVAAILTGMGNDGAEAMQALRENGAYTMAQDEASSVVYGMPREAVRLGAVAWSGPPAEIAAMMIRRCGRLPAEARLTGS